LRDSKLLRASFSIRQLAKQKSSHNGY